MLWWEDSNHPRGDSTDNTFLQDGGLPHIINLFLYPHPRDRRACLPDLHTYKSFSNTPQCAEEQGFEPQIPFSMPVFKTGAFNHSAILPNNILIHIIIFYSTFSFFSFLHHLNPTYSYIGWS